jgi:hypothetical protein
MADLSTYAKNKFVDLMRGTTWTTFTGYLALSTTTPTDANTNVTEPVGNGYSRQAITFSAPSDGSSTNSEITFTASGGNWGTITHAVIYDASTSGNMIAWDALSTSRAVNDGDTLTFAATTGLTLDVI